MALLSTPPLGQQAPLPTLPFVRGWIVDRLADESDLPYLQFARRTVSQAHNYGIWAHDRPDSEVLATIRAGNTHILELIIDEQARHVHPELAPHYLGMQVSAKPLNGPDTWLRSSAHAGAYTARMGELATSGYHGKEAELYAGLMGPRTVQLSGVVIDPGGSLRRVFPRHRVATSALLRDIIAHMVGQPSPDDTSLVLDSWLCLERDPTLTNLNAHYRSEGLCEVRQLTVANAGKCGEDVIATAFELCAKPFTWVSPSSNYLSCGDSAVAAQIVSHLRERSFKTDINSTVPMRYSDESFSTQQTLMSGHFSQELSLAPLVVAPHMNSLVFAEWTKVLLSLVFKAHLKHGQFQQFGSPTIPTGGRVSDKDELYGALIAWENLFDTALIGELSRVEQRPLLRLRDLINAPQLSVGVTTKVQELLTRRVHLGGLDLDPLLAYAKAKEVGMAATRDERDEFETALKLWRGPELDRWQNL
jgi:hypothetical protein